MIFAKDLPTLYRKHRAELLRLVALDAPPFDRGRLVYRLTDLDGRRYYGCADPTDLPLERFGRQQEYLTWMSAALDATELRDLVTRGIDALAAGVKAPKNAARIGMILQELLDRADKVVHLELLYNFVAVALVREDEDPGTFNAEVQLDKVAALRALAASGGGGFFFQLPELKKICELWSLSSAEWASYSSAFTALQNRHQAVLAVLDGASSSAPATAPAPAARTSSTGS